MQDHKTQWLNRSAVDDVVSSLLIFLYIFLFKIWSDFNNIYLHSASKMMKPITKCCIVGHLKMLESTFGILLRLKCNYCSRLASIIDNKLLSIIDLIIVILIIAITLLFIVKQTFLRFRFALLEFIISNFYFIELLFIIYYLFMTINWSIFISYLSTIDKTPLTIYFTFDCAIYFTLSSEWFRKLK